ncbi:outer membrane beta-barrel protein [Pontibacter qinzhouensis]|uniref:outer membrane beta-barrel protein n=1 Tax=Pontibacter qinzhouensis TaxID=2603253 RepID=UPI00164FD7EE|nr:outer membrane beta-barrel protein [Pontibacter qinzhouensis]
MVTTAGDTVQGFINYKEWVLSPTSFSFKKSATDPAVTEFDVHAASYFEITGLEAYQRYEGPITTNVTDLKNLTYNTSLEVTNATVFLKVLEKGEIVKLLSYTDMLKTRFFVQEQHNAQPQELYYNLYLNSQRKVVTQKGYIGQLLHLAATYEVKTPQLERAIQAANYRDYTFIDIAKAINKPKDAPAATPFTSGNFRFFAGIGLSSNQATVTGKHSLQNADKASANLAPQLLVGADLFVNQHVQRLLLRLELAASATTYTLEKTERSGSGVTEHTYSLSQKTASLNPQVIYNVYNTENLKGFFSIGGQLNYSSFSDNTYNSQYYNPTIPYDYAPTVEKNHFDIHPIWVSITVRGGVAINRKLEVLAAYMPPASVSNNNVYSLKLTSYTLGLNYFLNRR